MSAISRFLRDIDGEWKDSTSGRTTLRIIGSTALMLQTAYQRGTNDSDVLEAHDLAPSVRDALVRSAGKGTDLHQRHRLYIDIVQNGIPFLPGAPRWHPAPELALDHFDIVVLDVVDVVVSKLKRFSASDRGDVQAMVDLDCVPHVSLLARFRAAVDAFSMDARAEDLPRYVRNLNTVERDMLLVEESAIELPSWI